MSEEAGDAVRQRSGAGGDGATRDPLKVGEANFIEKGNEIWRTEPDLRSYTALIPATPLSDRNPARGTGAIESRKLDLRYEDVAAEDAFNRILWYTIKGTKLPYPGPTRMSAAEVVRSW